MKTGEEFCDVGSVEEVVMDEEAHPTGDWALCRTVVEALSDRTVSTQDRTKRNGDNRQQFTVRSQEIGKRQQFMVRSQEIGKHQFVLEG